jgi:hypothetical protein
VIACIGSTSCVLNTSMNSSDQDMGGAPFLRHRG